MDPLGGALFEFGQVAGSAFDFADPAGGHGQRFADLLLRDAVARAQTAQERAAFPWRLPSRVAVSDGDEGLVRLAGDVAFETADDLELAFSLPRFLRHVVAGGLVVSEPDDGDAVQCHVALRDQTGR